MTLNLDDVNAILKIHQQACVYNGMPRSSLEKIISELNIKFHDFRFEIFKDASHPPHILAFKITKEFIKLSNDRIELLREKDACKKALKDVEKKIINIDKNIYDCNNSLLKEGLSG